MSRKVGFRQVQITRLDEVAQNGVFVKSAVEHFLGGLNRISSWFKNVLRRIEEFRKISDFFE
jgi:hypothetical protein